MTAKSTDGRSIPGESPSAVSSSGVSSGGGVSSSGVSSGGGVSSSSVSSGGGVSSSGVSDGFSKISEVDVHHGRMIRLVEARFTTPDGHPFTRDVVRHTGAVAVVAVEGDEVVLVRQFRAPLEHELLEIPAGKRDVAGEPPEETARRELAEEAGLSCESMIVLGSFYNSPGFTDELSHVFLATGLENVPTGREGAEEQWMSVVRVGLSDVIPMITRGEICDAKTVIGLLLALRWLGL